MDSGVSGEIAAFFQDPDASNALVLTAQQIAAPVVQGAVLTENEVMMGGGIRVVFFIIDASPSMADVAGHLRDGFNHDFVPAVKDAREEDISALRIGGMAFSSDMDQIWRGVDGSYFHPVDQLPELTTEDYDPRRGWGTALHEAILMGSARALRYAGELQQETGVDVDVDIVILSDGANNAQPLSPRDVRRMIVGRDPSRVRYLFFYFETELGLANPKEYATRDLGIDGEQVVVFLRQPGETAEEQARRFRFMMAVMSRVSGARNTSAVIATAAVLDDDEIV